MKYTNIIWDFNGTLLNDIDVCIQSMNELLSKHHLPKLKGPEHYREIFGFPVQDYYEKAGFDFSKIPFAILAHEFIQIHKENCKKAELFPNVKTALQQLKKMGCNQYLVSATEQKSLLEQLMPYHISEYFTEIRGIQDHFAKSKAAVAEELIQNRGLDRKSILFIGDCVHDFEVAVSVGCDCVLISGGHQSTELLKKTGVKIVTDVTDIFSL